MVPYTPILKVLIIVYSRYLFMWLSCYQLVSTWHQKPLVTLYSLSLAQCLGYCKSTVVLCLVNIVIFSNVSVLPLDSFSIWKKVFINLFLKRWETNVQEDLESGERSAYPLWPESWKSKANSPISLLFAIRSRFCLEYSLQVLFDHLLCFIFVLILMMMKAIDSYELCWVLLLIMPLC